MAWFPCNLNSNLGNKPVLLWSNDNISSGNSSYTASIDTTKYDSFIFEYYPYINNKSNAQIGYVNKNKTNAQGFYIAYCYSNTATTRRPVTINSNSIVIGTCLSGSDTDYMKTNNNYLIPAKIYGVNLNF